MKMNESNRTPNDLAHEILAELRRRKQPTPPLGILEKICNVAFYASLETEESKPIIFHLLYLDPDNPDPKPPMRIRNNRWMFFRFPNPIPLTVSNLVKIARASDPRSSSLVIYQSKPGKLSIVGLVDQANNYSEYIRYEQRSGFAPPGLFHLGADGIGRLTAGIEMQTIAELRLDHIIRTSIDVFRKGPIRERLNVGINNFEQVVRKLLGEALQPEEGEWSLPSFPHDWISTLCRLLLRIQAIRHGGALLITPTKSTLDLKIKYPINYDRLPKALVKNAILSYQYQSAGRIITNDYLDRKADDIPSDLYLDEFLSADDLNDSWLELDSTIWFLALLSRVDGLILLDPNLRVRGFGVEILSGTEPTTVYLARTATANNDTLKKMSYYHFGTRHRSMLRYCSQVPKSLGFVVSQDGDVRAIANVKGKVILWENIRLQLKDFVSRNRRRWHAPYY